MLTEPVGRVPASSGRASDGSPDALSDTFDVLMSAVHSGLGDHVSAVSDRLHHDTGLFVKPEGSPRQERLQQMADQAHARVTGGRHSRLDPGLRADGAGIGPRGHRLALQAEEQVGQPRTETGKAVPNGKPQLNEQTGKAGATTTGQHSDSGPARVPNARPVEVSTRRTTASQKPVKPDAVQTGTGQRDTTVSSGRAPEASQPPSGPAVGAAGVDAVRSSARSAPVARQIAQILSVRAGGAQSARAVTGTEQTGTARGVATTSDPSQTGNRSGKANTAKAGTQAAATTTSPEPAQRSAFEQLVRSLRMNVGRQRSTARLHLRPPELGRIRIDARMDGQRLEILVQTETAAARELLRSRVAELQTALEQHGIKIDRLEFAPTGLQNQQDSTGAFAGAGDPDTRRSAFRHDRERAASRGEANRITAGDESAPSVDEGEAEPISSAAAETRLDVRV